VTIYAFLTPAQRLSTEDAINENLAQQFGAYYRVCLHPDRTATKIPYGYRIECDYCPGWAEVFAGGTWPDIEPVYYEDPTRSTARS
jgi:hypothetical protein